jgi:hypothetical protein
VCIDIKRSALYTAHTMRSSGTGNHGGSFNARWYYQILNAWHLSIRPFCEWQRVPLARGTLEFWSLLDSQKYFRRVQCINEHTNGNVLAECFVVALFPTTPVESLVSQSHLLFPTLVVSLCCSVDLLRIFETGQTLAALGSTIIL